MLVSGEKYHTAGRTSGVVNATLRKGEIPVSLFSPLNFRVLLVRTSMIPIIKG